MSVRKVSWRHIFWRTILADAQHAVARPREFRNEVVRELWSAAKRFGARGIESVELDHIDGLGDKPMTGYFDDRQGMIIAGLCERLGARTFFEFGTYRGRTTWTVARNNPGIRAFTLDLPSPEAASHTKLEFTDIQLLPDWSRGEAFRETPEADRITALQGDSATFDYSPYEASIDVIYVDGSHSYSYVKNDTEAALRMLTPQGAIVWDDYPGYAGVYAYLEEFAQRTDTKLLHIHGTRLVIYSRQPLPTKPARGSASPIRPVP